MWEEGQELKAGLLKMGDDPEGLLVLAAVLSSSGGGMAHAKEK